MNKVAEVTFLFWVLKICATTLGETAGDLLSMTMGLGYAKSSLLLLTFFLISVSAQLLATRCISPLYWMVILSTSTAGTTISDFMDRTLELGYATGSAILFGLLLLVLLVWRWSEGSLSVSHISSKRAEVFYWLAILVSNTLGTASGDFLADDSGLGFVGGSVLIGAFILADAAAYLFTSIDRVLLFWFAFVLTRPFGANVGDLLTKSHEKGGFDLGTGGSSLVLGAVLCGLLLYSSWRDRREKEGEE